MQQVVGWLRTADGAKSDMASAAIRILPELSLLGADPDRTWLEKVSQLSHGLVLITGSSGSGKSTTMARILSLISQKRACHVVTLEDPVEYVIPMEKALIHQREIGRDVVDFPQGIRDALREDPDVIALGEMRDSETISAALTAAETGHLVLGTLHTTRAKDVPARIIHAFPGDRQEEIRGLLAANLVTVSSQMLYRSGKETWLLREILTNVAAVAHLIREGKASLDDPLSAWLPDSTKVPTFEGKPILLRHLVTHTSGLPAIPAAPMPLYRWRRASPNGAIKFCYMGKTLP